MCNDHPSASGGGPDTIDTDDATDAAGDRDGEAVAGESATGECPDVEVVLELQASLRAALKEPFGPVFEDATDLIAAAGEPLIAVGDIVTYHLVEAGRTPDVALVDERTERSAVDPAVRRTVSNGTADGSAWFDREIRVCNPAATLTAPLLSALSTALDCAGPATIVVVDGEEDLATIPAVLAAPSGASVVYGQPGEGMVHVRVDPPVRERVVSIFERMDGDQQRARELLASPQ